MGERVTIELDAEALAAAREAGVDLSELLSRALRRHLSNLNAAEREEAARQWYRENKEAVDAYNAMIEKNGLFSATESLTGTFPGRNRRIHPLGAS